MTTPDGLNEEPLWLAIEKKILELGSHDFSGDKLERSVQLLAAALDDGGFAVSKNAGHMLDLRGALGARVSVGRPLMGDLDKAFVALTLEDVESPYTATVSLINEVGGEWPALKESGRRPQLLRMVEKTKLDLLVAKAKGLEGDGGVRLLIGEGVVAEVIVERMEITLEEFDRVMAAVEAELAERVRVAELLRGEEGKTEAEKIRHLITSGVSEELIIEIAEVDQSAIDGVKKAMEEEIAEKQRLVEEAAAKKAAAAAGPSLDDIPPDEMLEHIEAIREIMEFSDAEAEIRVMCEQSSVPKDLVDIAVSEPDRLDELEAQAEG
jgi:predicted component of type VI protein secretion system